MRHEQYCSHTSSCKLAGELGHSMRWGRAGRREFVARQEGLLVDKLTE